MAEAARRGGPSPVEEKARLLAELNILTNQRDGIDEAIKARKTRLESLMNADGDRVFESDFDGGAVFTPRRSFRVVDRGVLVKRCSKAFLAEGFKPTATLVDALAQKGISIDGMVSVGLTESFTYRRPTTKEAEKLRKRMIAETRERADERVAEVLKTL